MAETKNIWTPNGIKRLSGRANDRVDLRPGLVEWLVQFEAFAKAFQLGLHCAKCGADVIGRNAETDRVYTASCGCRDFVGTNRDYREPTTAEAFYDKLGGS